MYMCKCNAFWLYFQIRSISANKHVQHKKLQIYVMNIFFWGQTCLELHVLCLDIVRTASTREDEVHNCQVVIDSLAGDVLHTSLTHISGADIIDGNRESISNLLEIFSGLLEYMLNKIDSDISIDHGKYWLHVIMLVCTNIIMSENWNCF